MRISLPDVQRNISDIANRAKYTPEVIYELLAAYGRSSSAITQLQSGHLNKAESSDAVLQKEVVYFRTFPEGAQLELKVQELFEDPLTERYKPRYLIATDLIRLAAKDTIKGTTLTIKLADIDNELDFFYAWTGDEIVDTKTEAVADRRAADKMNELYVEIEKENRDQFVSDPSFRHKLNVFFTRLLFCFFAEDTKIYKEKQFTDAIKTFTQVDGSDLSWFFDELFKALDTKDLDKPTLKVPFKDFPYVNGSIFNTSKHSIVIPRFSAQSRHLIIECGRQNWGEINPDIFGTMFQGIVDPNSRDENGMDYTSVTNIMKVISPLFLDELHELFDKYYDNEQRLWALLNRISKIKVFDPACGSGNFLIIAYKELRQLQHAIIGRIDELKPGGLAGGIPSSNLLEVDHLFGIEVDDFAHELAILSIFLAKHQMNQEFNKRFGTSLAIIPLIELKTIVCGNAAQINWQEVCRNIGHTQTKAQQEALFDFNETEQTELKIEEVVYDEIYIIGNPPYKGASKQTASQKQDMSLVFNGFNNYKNLDYIAIWFKKGTDFIFGTKAQLSFVTTNSITQGQQIELLWPYIINDNKVEISHAYTSFKWRNSARDNAGVTVVIIGLRNNSSKKKILIDEGIASVVDNINPYLVASKNVIIGRRSRPISKIPAMLYGSKPADNGFLLLDEDEKNNILSTDPEAAEFIKRAIGAADIMSGQNRYCLWINDDSFSKAMSIEKIKKRIESVRDFRINSKKQATKALASIPYAFGERRYRNTRSLILPVVSSENRRYIPIIYADSDVVPLNTTQIIINGELSDFAILNSSMHMVWTRAVSGKLESRLSYSSSIVWNNFPLNPLTEIEKEKLRKSARNILLARATHPEMTLAEMYSIDKMPVDLLEAHGENDHLVDNLYKSGGFKNNDERITMLFNLYEIMTAKENQK